MNYKKGFISSSVILALLGVLVVGGAVYYTSKNFAPKNTISEEVNLNEGNEQNESSELQNQQQDSACNSNDPRSITITSPNGGESYQSGQQVGVTWNTCNPNVNDQVMVLLKSNQTPFGAEIVTVPNTGSATITLPTSFGGGQVPVTAGQYYKIRLELGGNAMGQQAPQDESDGLFTIN